MMHVCGCITGKGEGTYYGNSAVMNVLEQLKLNLNCITCCFEYTSLICLSLMYYQVQPSGIALVSKFRGGAGREGGFKILSARNAKFMNTPLTSQLDLCEIIIHYLMLKHS